MSGPVSFGDIVRAIELCVWIRQKCFDPLENADIRYAEFRKDVLTLEQRLKYFQASFEKALLHSSIDHSRYALLKLEAEELVGDFNATLHDCRVLLEKYVRFERHKATALDNAFWHSSTQSRVDQLRSRIQSHTYKLFLIVEPVQLDLVPDILSNTHEILDLLRRHFGLLTPIQLPEIPPAVDGKFWKAIKWDCPFAYEDALHIPLQEGVDALSVHFRECTFQSTSPGIGPSLNQNLSLLKAHWLVNVLEASQSFNESRPGSLYRRIIKQVEQGVEDQYRNRGTDRWVEEEFATLNDSAFAIWPVKKVKKPLLLTEPAAREDKLVQVPLICEYQDQKEDLFIFRVKDRVLRMVRSRNSQDGSLGSQMTERFVDLHDDGLIPVYSVADPSGNRWNLTITNGKGGGSVAHQFWSRRDVFRIQQCFTGYETASYSEGVSCAITYRRAMPLVQNPQSSGYGEIHLWTWPVSISLDKEPLSPTTTVDSSGSIRSGSAYTTASTVFRGFDPSIISVSEQSNGEDLVVAGLPPPPLLVSFVRKEGKYTMWKANLSDLEISESCRINNQKYRTVLRRIRGKHFPIQRLVANESDLDSWNLCALVIPGYPMPKAKQQPRVEDLECTGFAVDFKTKEKQEWFEGHFKAVVVQRHEHEKQLRLSRDLAKAQANQPTRRPSSTVVNSRRTSASDLTLRRFSRTDSGTVMGRLPERKSTWS